MHFEEHDQWTAADLLRHLRYERGRLVCKTDYVRGRMMKTDVTVFPDGRFTLTTTDRGEAASRWVTQIQGKKVLRPVPAGGEWPGGVTAESVARQVGLRPCDGHGMGMCWRPAAASRRLA